MNDAARAVDLSIIIVSWNTRDLLERCLETVAREIAGRAVETIVVDNASHDGSSSMVAARFPWVQLIANRDNVGFAAGNNQAYQVASGRYVLMLNPDTRLREASLGTLVDFMESHPRAGAAGSMLLNPDETLQPSCYPAPTLGRELWRLLHLDALWPHGVYRMHTWDMRQPRQVDVLMGACVILRRTALERVGFLDEAYFMYSEEVDLMLRLRRQGWQVWWVPCARVVHYGGQSTRQVAVPMFLHLYAAKVRYFRKNYGEWTARAYKLVVLVASLPRILLWLVAHWQPEPRRERYASLAGRYARLVGALRTL